MTGSMQEDAGCIEQAASMFCNTKCTHHDGSEAFSFGEWASLGDLTVHHVHNPMGFGPLHTPLMTLSGSSPPCTHLGRQCQHNSMCLHITSSFATSAQAASVSLLMKSGHIIVRCTPLSHCPSQWQLKLLGMVASYGLYPFNHSCHAYSCLCYVYVCLCLRLC